MDYISVTPQYDEFGYESDLWMVHADEGICPNLMLGWRKGEYRMLVIGQVEDGYEDDWEGHLVDLGTMDCSRLTDDERDKALARRLYDDENAWWLC